METKKEFKYFTIIDYEKEQDYLRKMHQSGWRLVRVSGFCVYHFEKCDPQDVVYQLDYNKDGRAHKDAYVQMFRDCGWEYLQDYAGFSYFRKAACQAGEEIFCDEDSKRQMMERIFMGRTVLLMALFFLVLIPGLAICLRYGAYAACALLGATLAFCVLIFIGFARRYFKFKTRA